MANPLIVGGVIEIGKRIINHIFPDKAEQARAQHELDKLQLSGQLQLWLEEMGLLRGQQDINKEEAKHASVFVAGWRPFCGWVCGLSLAYHFICQPLLAFLITMFAWEVPPLPTFDMGTLLTVLLGMLGLSGWRTLDKTKNVARDKF